MQAFRRNLATIIFLFIGAAVGADAQSLNRELSLEPGGTIEIINRSGRVIVTAAAAPPAELESAETKNVSRVALSANSKTSIAESEVRIESHSGRIVIAVAAASPSKQIDLSLAVPERVRVKIETGEGEVRVAGNLELVEVRTETGTIAADVPTDALKYSFNWTEARPRFVSDIEIEKVKEKSGGKFEIRGRYPGKVSGKERAKVRELPKAEREDDAGSVVEAGTKGESDEELEKPKVISLNLTTARGIILLNVPPNEVSSDLRARPLTDAAKAIIRSGDSMLMEAIRRAAPEYFGDYARTLPPMKREPAFVEKTSGTDVPRAAVKRVTVRVTDMQNRAISGLKADDFSIAENNELREIMSVEPATASVNLVLLLDVSGSVNNYVNFIRKAARSFIDTVDRNDRLSIVLFNDDVKVLSKFTNDKSALSESLDTFDAGGSTALYDSLGYTLTDTLRPLKGERTAIVVLTDGDDNRSFLPFDSLLGSIQESGALVYPLYVPSALIAASENNPAAAIDPLRSRYIGLTSKAEGEGEQLARISGGVYYPITQLSQIQKAYEDIAMQLRTAYVVRFRSEVAGTGVSPRLKVKTKKENTFATVFSVIADQ